MFKPGNNHGGKRIGAGRKGYYQEADVKDIISLSLNTIRCFLKDPNIDINRKAEIASRFIVKTIPTDINLKATLEQLITFTAAKSDIPDQNRLSDLISLPENDV